MLARIPSPWSLRSLPDASSTAVWYAEGGGASTLGFFDAVSSDTVGGGGGRFPRFLLRARGSSGESRGREGSGELTCGRSAPSSYARRVRSAQEGEKRMHVSVLGLRAAVGDGESSVGENGRDWD
jgi:hypothetical protein